MSTNNVIVIKKSVIGQKTIERITTTKNDSRFSLLNVSLNLSHLSIWYSVRGINNNKPRTITVKVPVIK